MAHLPYADLSTPEAQPLVQRIVAERGSVLHLYQMLLHSPPLAEGWLGFLAEQAFGYLTVALVSAVFVSKLRLRTRLILTFLIVAL